jgi:hypothetical protein
MELVFVNAQVDIVETIVEQYWAAMRVVNILVKTVVYVIQIQESVNVRQVIAEQLVLSFLDVSLIYVKMEVYVSNKQMVIFVFVLPAILDKIVKTAMFAHHNHA